MSGNCPSDDELMALLDGAMDDDVYRVVEAHIEECITCRVALERLTAAAGGAWLTAARPAPSSELAPVLAGIPGYTILGELGRGGHGVIFRALDSTLQRPVALKVVKTGALVSPAERAKFLAEARTAATLRHPHIVPIFAVGEHAGVPFFTMELLEGGSLDRRLRGEPQDPVEAAGLVERLALATQHAHDRGILHRDLKPANVLLADATLADPRISDFGIAKPADLQADRTPTGAVLGTPGYMAPEQADGRSGRVGVAADIFALGAILYELLTGRPPFRASTPFETLLLTRSSEPVAPARLSSQVPSGLDGVCRKCLRKRPDERYESAAALAEDLRCFLEGRPVLAGQGPSRNRRRVALAGFIAVAISACVSSLILTGPRPGRRRGMVTAAAGRGLARGVESRATQAIDAELWERLESASGSRSSRLEAARTAVDLARRSPEAASRLQERLRLLSATEPEETAVARATRAANLGCMLIAAGDDRVTRPLLMMSPNPTVRTRLIAALGDQATSDPRALLDRAVREADPGIRQALVLALGSTDPPPAEDLAVREGWVGELLRLYSEDDDPGVHGAAEWALRRWGHLERAKAARSSLAGPTVRGTPDSRGWYIGPDRHTLVIIPPTRRGEGPREGAVSPAATGSRAFAIGTHEVSSLQLEDFLRKHPGHQPVRINRGHPACPVPLSMARAYCNWLSQQDGLGDELCYEAREGDEFVPTGDFLDRRGYRLPTGAEWRVACFAGAVTPYPYGHGEDAYATHGLSSRSASGQRPQNVGRLMPNAYGLFDMLGNACEWCELPEGQSATACGGSYLLPPMTDREIVTDPSTNANAIRSVGFRVARTWIPASSSTMARGSR